MYDNTTVKTASSGLSFSDIALGGVTGGAVNSDTITGTIDTISTVDPTNISNVVGDIANSILAFDFSFLSSLDCLGGSAFDNELEPVYPVITTYFLGLIDNYNQAIINKQWEKVHFWHMKYWSDSAALEDAYKAKLSEPAWNSCSKKGLQQMIDFLENNIRNILGKALDSHIKYYFAMNGATFTYNNDYDFTAAPHDTFRGVEMYGVYTSWYKFKDTFTYRGVTPDIGYVKAFKITSYLESAFQNTSSYNESQFLTSVESESTTVYGSTSSDSTNGSSDTSDDSGSSTPKTPTMPSNSTDEGGSSLGILAVIVLVFKFLT